MQLPVAGWFGKGPYFRYPEGWETRPAPPFWLARMYLVAAAVVIVVVLTLGLLLTLLGGR